MTSELGDITLPDTDFDRLAQEIIDDKRIEDAKKSIQNGDSFFSHDVEALIETFEKQFDQLKSEVEKKDAEIKRLIALDMERMRWADDELAKKDARIRELESMLSLEKKAHDLSVANEEKLETALKDFSEHGLRADLNPTQPIGSWTEVTQFFLNYLKSIDSNVRMRARSALGLGK